MAKLNKTRTIAAALLGTVVLAAPVTSFAQDFRTTSKIASAHVTSNGFANRGFNGRNGFASQTISYRQNNRYVKQRLYQIDREIHSANLKIDQLKYEEDRLKDKRRHTRNRTRIKHRLKEIDRKIDYLKDVKRDLKREARKIQSIRY